MFDRRLLLTSTTTVLDVEIFELNLVIWAVVIVRGKVGVTKFVQATVTLVFTSMQLYGVRLVLYHSIVTRMYDLLGMALERVNGRT